MLVSTTRHNSPNIFKKKHFAVIWVANACNGRPHACINVEINDLCGANRDLDFFCYTNLGADYMKLYFNPGVELSPREEILPRNCTFDLIRLLYWGQGWNFSPLIGLSSTPGLIRWVAADVNKCVDKRKKQLWLFKAYIKFNQLLAIN